MAITIGILLLWLRATLATPGHLAAGILLIAVPGGLALALAGSSLTAATGLATAAILIASAVTGFRALASGTLTPPHLRPDPARSRRRQTPCRRVSFMGQQGRAGRLPCSRVIGSRRPGCDLSVVPRRVS